MTAAGQFEDLAGCSAVDREGSAAGTVSRIYVSDATGQPEWVLVNTVPDGSGSSFAPLAGSAVRGGQLVLGVPARLVSEAPRPGLDSAGRLSPAGTGVLYQHYARYLGDTGTGTFGDEPVPGGPARADDAGPGDGAQDPAMVLSEERLHAATETVVTGRARLVRYVVTEEVTLTVSVSREEARIEMVPIGAAEQQPASGQDEDLDVTAQGSARDGGWMILHAERPVVQMQSVPVERIRLRVETVTGQQEITGQVRKEQLDALETGTLPAAPG